MNRPQPLQSAENLADSLEYQGFAVRDVDEAKRLMRRCPPDMAQRVIDDTALSALYVRRRPSLDSLRWRVRLARAGTYDIQLSEQFLTWLQSQLAPRSQRKSRVKCVLESTAG